MHIWQLRRAEFVGTAVGERDGRPPDGSSLGWEFYSQTVADYVPDTDCGRQLTGENQGYRIAPMIGHSKWFMIHDTSQTPEALVAFYDDQFLAVRPGSRARWLAEELILAAEEARGVVSNKVRQVNTSSQKSFERAHKLAVMRAYADLEDIPQDVLGEYGLKPLWVPPTEDED